MDGNHDWHGCIGELDVLMSDVYVMGTEYTF